MPHLYNVYPAKSEFKFGKELEELDGFALEILSLIPMEPILEQAYYAVKDRVRGIEDTKEAMDELYTPE